LAASLTGCGREAEKPFEPWRANDPPSGAFRVAIKTGMPANPLPTIPEEPEPTPVEPPRPEAGLPLATPLSPEEAALVGTYRLREFIAMQGQVPGGDSRLNGTITLAADGRRVTLRVTRHLLLPPPRAGWDYVGGGRWRAPGDEVVFEPFLVVLPSIRNRPEDGESRGLHLADQPLTGPWVARWRVVREDGHVLLKGGEFTYERVPPK
jgi:hypothetical protein